ncbi:LamG domain-containing protein, partial [Mariniflexile sp.]|uniref:LamG domain-containing protein n=1 Tax=Mariniflexile sp. TaxID=1979402 RepID=UPI00356AD38F
MKVNCASSCYGVFLLFVLFLTTGLHAQYCTPNNIGNFNTNYISKVSFGSINKSSSGTTGGYSNYTNTSSTDIQAGETINGTIEVTLDGWNRNENTIAVWMNFNNSDQDFDDSGEQFLFTFKDNKNKSDLKTVEVSISIPVPETALAGASVMRIAFRTGVSTDFTSCDFKYQSGELEDYKINILSDYSSIGGGNEYPMFCTPTNIGSFNINYISKVSLGSINNSSSGTTGGYTYFSSLESANVTVGKTLEGTVSVTLNGWNTSKNTVVVWMNFNEDVDDDFEDSNEQFLFTFQDKTNPSGNKIVEVPISIPIPESAGLRKSVIRIAIRTGNKTNFTSCDFNYEAGEIEDYKIEYTSETTDLPIADVPTNAMLRFNGKDNYLTGSSMIDGLSEVTIMAWVKSDEGNTSSMTIVGEDVACKLWLKNGNIPMFSISTDKNSTKSAGDCSNCTINYNEWHHLAGSFSSEKGILKLYLDGVLIDSYSTKKDNKISVSSNANKTFEIGRYSNKNKDEDYFKGDIDEVRVFDIALTDSQIQQMVCQEIENNEGYLKGKVLEKDILDTETKDKISWDNLLAYYPMTGISSNIITDYSSNDYNLTYTKISTILEQTAPMPYVTGSDGGLESKETWLHGEVWSIEEALNQTDNGILRISNNVTINESLKTLALIVDEDKTLTVNGDNELLNTWYLELNGTIDLKNDSQLVQTNTSDLVTSESGQLLRRQEGTSNVFWYNYWSSPVGIKGKTNLIDNNTAVNNINNSSYTLNMLKDESGVNMQFTSAYNQAGKISTYWLYAFKNGVTYWDWTSVKSNTQLEPGVGYTQKGTGNAGLQQQYIFQGKPNNGTIVVKVTDKGGPGSVANKSKTEYLLGNPYPSALDIYQFIDDNKDVIGGTIQLWQQWGGTSHNLSEYQGGYAQVNKLGAIRASQFSGIYGATTGSVNGTLPPERYFPVGQGFIVEVIASGDVVFKNSQRAFVKETDALGIIDGVTSILKSSGKQSKSTTDTTGSQTGDIQKIRLEFNTVSGPATKRELLLGFSETTTDGYDYGYDAENFEENNNDFNLSLDGKNMYMQAYGPISSDKVVPLNFKSSGSNTFEIKATEFTNFDESQTVYLKDNLTDTYFDLKQNTSYKFSSTIGKFNTRFEIVFQSKQESLSTQEELISEHLIYYHNDSKMLFGKKLNTDIDKISIVDMRGQIVQEFNNISEQTLTSGLRINSVATG